MMNIKLYQINAQRDSKNIAFTSYDSMESFAGRTGVDSSIYDLVFSGKVECKTIEGVYTMFNINHPEGYKGRSMSVSDILEVTDEYTGLRQFFYCEPFGFKKVDFSPELVRNSENPDGKKGVTVLLIKAGQPPEKTEIDGSLLSMQKLVGGYIEVYMPFDDDVAIICNDEGKVNGLPLNRAIYEDMSEDNPSGERKIQEIIAGDFFLGYYPDNSENIVSLPDNLCDKYTEIFKVPEKFYRNIYGEIGVSKVNPTRDTEAR